MQDYFEKDQICWEKEYLLDVKASAIDEVLWSDGIQCNMNMNLTMKMINFTEIFSAENDIFIENTQVQILKLKEDDFSY